MLNYCYIKYADLVCQCCNLPLLTVPQLLPMVGPSNIPVPYGAFVAIALSLAQKAGESGFCHRIVRWRCLPVVNSILSNHENRLLWGGVSVSRGLQGAAHGNNQVAVTFVLISVCLISVTLAPKGDSLLWQDQTARQSNPRLRQGDLPAVRAR